MACADKYELGPKVAVGFKEFISIDDRREMEAKPELNPEPAGGAYFLRSAFERPRIPSA